MPAMTMTDQEVFNRIPSELVGGLANLPGLMISLAVADDHKVNVMVVKLTQNLEEVAGHGIVVA
jgi:hypothetical protein